MHTAQRLDAVLAEALERKGALSYEEIVFLLSLKDESSLEKLFAAAREVKKRFGKSDVLPRGLIEISNRCPRDCFYCGIRASNASARRYSMSRGEILECVRAARLRSLPAVAFQSGEIQSEANTAFYEGLLREISVEGEWRLRFRWVSSPSKCCAAGRLPPVICVFAICCALRLQTVLFLEKYIRRRRLSIVGWNASAP
jgi:2-iminoacetate synthase ThiH